MARHVLARLTDIDQAITALMKAVKGRTLGDLTSDWTFGQACQYALQTIGEAANNLPPELRGAYPDVPWRQIIGLSHKIRHEYFRIDPDLIWEVLTVHVPPLHKVIKRILADIDQPALPL